MESICKILKNFSSAIYPVLGHGTFGIVEKAEWNVPDDKAYIVAVKTPNAQKDFKNELHKLAALKHRNIIRLFGITTIRSKIALVMEYAECGSLYSFLHPDSSNQPPVKYSFEHVISWSLQCAKAMEYLHSIPIVHRDLKPPNMLLADHGRVLKICDFGTASYLRPEMSHSKGSIKWMAPEVSKGCHYTEKCDVYSFSIVLWEMLTRKKPYHDIERIECILFKVHAGTRPGPVAGISDCLNSLMKRCWDEDPSIRPSFTEILQYFEKCIKERKMHGPVEPLAMFEKANIQAGCNVENDDVPPELPPKLQKHRVADNISESSSKVKEEKSSIEKGIINAWMHQHDNYANIFNNELNIRCTDDTQTEFDCSQYFVNYAQPFSPLFDLVDTVNITGKLITKQSKDLNGIHNLPQGRNESKVSMHSTSISKNETYSELLERRRKLQRSMEELDTKKENIKNKRKLKKEKLKKEKREIENVRTANQAIKDIHEEGNGAILPQSGSVYQTLKLSFTGFECSLD